MERVYKREGILFKILPCLLIAMYAVMCLFASYVCAVTSNISYNNNIYTFIYDDIYTAPRGYECPYYFIYYLPDDGAFRIVYASAPIIFNTENGLYNSSDNTVLFELNSTPSDFTVQFTYSNIFPFINGIIPPLDRIVLSSDDIVDSNGNVVFQSPTQKVGGIVATQVQGTQMDKTLQEITGILPVVLVVIVGLIAIRKAIQFLTVRLKKA